MTAALDAAHSPTLRRGRGERTWSVLGSRLARSGVPLKFGLRRLAGAERSHVLVADALEFGKEPDRLGRPGLELVELPLDRAPALENGRQRVPALRVRDRLHIGSIRGGDSRPVLLLLRELGERLRRHADRAGDLVKALLAGRDGALVPLELVDLRQEEDDGVRCSPKMLLDVTRGSSSIGRLRHLVPPGLRPRAHHRGFWRRAHAVGTVAREHTFAVTEDINRFVTAQEGTYQGALDELRRGRKTGHWIWFIFPQIAGLGRSAMSQRYAIGSLVEARAYLAHPVLGARLRECAKAVASVRGRTAEEILGSIDAVKLCSSMTLFHRAAPKESVFREVIDRYYGGRPDDATDALLRGDPES
jgi:uncharacterized protein (DUF1810 family)